MARKAEDFETEARARLAPEVWAYLSGGAEREITLAANRAQWAGIGLRPQMLRDLRGGGAGAVILGRALSFPALIAPMAFQRLLCPEGEAAMRLAAAAQGIGMVLSCQTSVAPEALPQAPTPLWFQLYLQPDPAATRALAARALAAGAEALVVTLDAPINGLREREEAAGFALPPGVAPVMLADLPPAALPEGESLAFRLMSLAPVWEDLAQLCAESPVPVLAKGILDRASAEAALAAGVRGLIVSNHGGRVLDGVATASEVLPDLRAALPEALILADGGIWRGATSSRPWRLAPMRCSSGGRRPWGWCRARKGRRRSCAA